MFEIVKLKNGLKFVVLAKLTFEGDKYLYLSSYETEKINCIFAKAKNDGSLEPVEDGELNIQLLSAVASKVPQN